MEKKDFLYEKKRCDAIDKTSSEEELEDQKRAERQKNGFALSSFLFFHKGFICLIPKFLDFFIPDDSGIRFGETGKRVILSVRKMNCAK